MSTLGMLYDIERSRGVEPRPATWKAAVQTVSLAPLVGPAMDNPLTI